MTKEYFINKARSIHGYKYVYLNLDQKLNLNTKIEMEYGNIVYSQRICKHLLGRCPEKNTQKKTTEEFIKESRKIWGDKYDYSLVEYRGAFNPVKILYRNIIFEQTPSGHINRKAPEEKLNLEYFILLATDKYGSDYDYSLVKYVNGATKVKIIHKNSGEVYEQSPSCHLKYRPENIKLSIRKTNDQFIKEANAVHDNKFSYEKTNYIKNQIKVIITCPIHGDFNQNPFLHLQGNGCPNCNESIGERTIVSFLKKYNINYSRQHKFSNCRNSFELPFDFYIPSLRICIEFDGKQHFQPIDYFGGIDAYNRLTINDRIKDDYCEDNYITLIRIRYDQVDSIYQILWENFKNKIKIKGKINI